MVMAIVVDGTRLSVREALDHAMADHRAGRLGDAEQVYKTILEAEPECADALGGLGLALLDQGVPDQAVQIFRRILSLTPDQALAHHNLGNALYACREFEQAANAYRQALEIDPTDGASAFELGNVLADLGKLEDAVAIYRRVLDIDPDHIDARCHLGTTWKDLGRFDEAEATLRETLRRQPAHPKAHTQLGLTLVAKGRIEDASEIILAPVRRYRAVAMAGPGTAPNFSQDFDRVNRTKIRHDIEQISYLLEHGCIAPNRKKLLGEYQAVLENFPDGADLKLSELSPPPSAVFRASYNRMVHFDPPGVLEGGVLNPDLDFAAIEADFFDGTPAFACIDDLLSAQALAGLRRFCMESTIWYQMTFPDELGTSLTNGFSCPLLFQISNQLRANLPNIFGDNQLKFCWAYKYYKNLSGLDLHADSAAISINFWITPDEANLDPGSGGLEFWDRTAPRNFFGRPLDEQGEILKRVIEEPGARAFKLPYRCNRGAIFKSDVVHRTDELNFKDGYGNRRINITMMYGEPGQ